MASEAVTGATEQNQVRTVRLRPGVAFSGEMAVPGDKSITHRALLFGALADGETRIRGWLDAGDCRSTWRCLEALGVPIRQEGDALVVSGAGPEAWREPSDVLDCGNSGTTMRLLLGALAGRPFFTVLTGDDSLRTRPMGRVAEPLRAMGAWVDGRDGGRRAPLAIRGGELRGIRWQSPVASAQVKSALLLAGLQAGGVTEILEPAPSRDHSERLLGAFGVRVRSDGESTSIEGGQRLLATDVQVPGDISAAAFFFVAAALVPGSCITVRGVGVNPTRTGVLDALSAMGAAVKVVPRGNWAGEPVADVTVASPPQGLSGVQIAGQDIPRVIDEIPVLAVAAALARGTTEIRDASELRVKESDRLAAIAAGLSRMGARVEELPDGLRIQGVERLRGALVDAQGDHRIAMALAVAALAAEGETVIAGADSVTISFPEFFRLLAAWQDRG